MAHSTTRAKRRSLRVTIDEGLYDDLATLAADNRLEVGTQLRIAVAVGITRLRVEQQRREPLSAYERLPGTPPDESDGGLWEAYKYRIGRP